MTRRRLPRRPLTSLGVSLTRVGLAIDAAPSPDTTAIRACIDGGVNWIDTAETQMDTLLGGPLADARHRIAVFVTVGGAATHGGNGRSAVRPAVEAWVRRAPRRVLIVPLLGCGAMTDIRAWESLQQLVDDGVIPALAVSDPSLESLHRCQDAADVNLVQVRLSLMDRAAAAEVLPECVSNGIEVLARTEPPADAGDRLASALSSVELRHGNLRTTAALAWALAWPGVFAAATAIANAEAAPALLDAAQLKLTAADLDDIAEALSEDRIGVGPVRPGVHA